MSMRIRFFCGSRPAKNTAPTAPAAGPDSRVAEACRMAVSAVITPPLEAVM